MKDKWIYSESEELYWEYSEEFESKEKAIESAKKDKELESNIIFVGKKVPASVQGIDVDSLLENIAENTTIGLDGFGEDFLMNVSNEHLNELEVKLNDVFFDWMHRNGYSPNWFEIEDIEEIKL